ncbi:MAG: hypothetical protein V8R40_06860 [Dysosmobacter sp.]
MRTIFKRAAAGLAAMCLTLLALSIPTEAGRERGTYDFNGEVVGYYAGWSAYQRFTPDQIPAEELTADQLCLRPDRPGQRDYFTGGCGSG